MKKHDTMSKIFYHISKSLTFKIFLLSLMMMACLKSNAQDLSRAIRMDDQTNFDKNISEQDRDILKSKIEIFLGKFEELASLKGYDSEGKISVTSEAQQNFQKLFDYGFNADIYDDLSYNPAMIKVSQYTEMVYNGFPKGLIIEIRDAYLTHVSDKGEFYEATLEVNKWMFQGLDKNNNNSREFKDGKGIKENFILTVNKANPDRISIYTIQGEVDPPKINKDQHLLTNLRFGCGIPSFTTGTVFNSKEAIDVKANLLMALGGEYRYALDPKNEYSIRIGLYYAVSKYSILIKNNTEINDPSVVLREDGTQNILPGNWKNTLFLSEATDYTLNLNHIQIPLGLNWKFKQYWNSALNLELSMLNDFSLSQTGKLKGSFYKRTVQDIPGSPVLCESNFDNANQDITYEKQSYSMGLRGGLSWHRNLVQDRIQLLVGADYTHYLNPVTLGEKAYGKTDGNSEIAEFNFGLPEIKPHQINLSLGVLFKLNK